MATKLCCLYNKSNQVLPVETSNSLTVSIRQESHILQESYIQSNVVMEKMDNDTAKLMVNDVEMKHDFRKKTFHKPTFCQHCSDLLWGLTNQGMQCTVCGYVTHEKCRIQIINPCNIKESTFVQIPYAHTLLKLLSEKKRFCNVCRRKIDDDTSLKCQCCPYYIHYSCKQYIVHNCKQTATYTSITEKISKKQQHHWTEGHLPLDAKCHVCLKLCASADCVAGLRCMWCLRTIHSYCQEQLDRYCDFGYLSNLVIPPYAIKKTNPIIYTKNQSKIAIDRPKKRRSKIQSSKDLNGIYIHSIVIYIGPANHPTQCNDVDITPASTASHIVSSCIKIFQIKEKKDKYFLTRTKSDNNEVKLHSEELLWPLLQNPVDENHPMIFLRRTNHDKKVIKITMHAGLIDSPLRSCEINVNIMSPSIEVILHVLKEFQMEKTEDPNNYRIALMNLTPDRVKEVFLELTESIYDGVQCTNKSQNGISKELADTHFYLQPMESPIEELLVYIGNLPTDLTKMQYSLLLRDVVGIRDDSAEISNIFPMQGAVVIKFSTMGELKKLIPQLSNAMVDGKKWFIKIVPEIKENLIPSSSTPLIVYVNSKSGGGQGQKLLTTFNRLLNPYQVIDITEAGPLPVLFMFRNISNLKILICGGDGTFGWVLSALDDIRHTVLKCSFPESALLPLGTGNDLSRVLCWGPGYTGESALNVLLNVSNALPVFLDRWNVVFDEVSFEENKTSKDNEEVALNIVPMNNYFGVGIDAELCLEFHLSREENPEKFNSRIYNKGVYFRAGLRNFTRSSMSNLQEKIELTVDGHCIDLPSIEGLAINNISSWAAGSEPWGKDRDERFTTPRYDDGKLEVLGFTGVYHMGKIKGGLATGIRLAQGAQINLVLKQTLPVQVDGEPWLQNPCAIMIRPTLLQAKMLIKNNSTKPRSKTPPPRTKFYHEEVDSRKRVSSEANVLKPNSH